MNSTLRDSIFRLYEIFCRYPLNPAMDASSVYGNREQYNSLLSGKPLENLTSDDLCIFAGKTMTTWGDVSDFKHFLPRMLELAALLDCPYEVCILFSKLEYARWETWDDAEMVAVRSYLESLWEFMLSCYTDEVRVEFYDYFVAIFRVHPSPGLLLSMWEQNERLEALLHLCDCVTEHFLHIESRRGTSSIFSLGAKAAEVRAWLFSPVVLENLERAFFPCQNEHYQKKLSSAHQILSYGC